MTRLTRSHTVPTGKRYRVREPAIEVDLGERLVVETVNFRTPVIRAPEDANPREYREREETGPVFIRGIAPGDVMAVRLHDIRPEGHASGGWWRSPEESSFLEIAGGKVHFPGGLAARLEPMVGDIYATPDLPPEGRLPNPWDNGGNMDFRDIAAPNTLLLRAELEGGLLVLGDLHAAQGDGEILGLGAECAGEVTLSVTRSDLPARRPTVLKADSFVSIACRRPYAEALELASGDAAGLLAHVTGASVEECRLYVTTVGHARNGAIWPLLGEREPGAPDWTRGMPLVVGVEVPMPGRA